MNPVHAAAAKNTRSAAENKRDTARDIHHTPTNAFKTLKNRDPNWNFELEGVSGGKIDILPLLGGSVLATICWVLDIGFEYSRYQSLPEPCLAQDTLQVLTSMVVYLRLSWRALFFAAGQTF
jgi:hypothetical protein